MNLELARAYKMQKNFLPNRFPIEDKVFFEYSIKFNCEDRFHFFTDGIENIFTKKISYKESFEIKDLNKFHLHLEIAFKNFFNNEKEFIDDCTLISFQIK